MLTDSVVVFVAEGIRRNSKVVIFPADSLRIRIYAKKVERRTISAVTIKPKHTIKIALEPQTPREGLFNPYNLLGPSMAYGDIRTLIVGVKVVG